MSEILPPELNSPLDSPHQGGEYDYFQTPSGLTVTQKQHQDGDYLLSEGSAQTFYPHPTPLQTGDSLLLESDGVRYEPIQPNPGDFLLDEAPPCGRRATR